MSMSKNIKDKYDTILRENSSVDYLEAFKKAINEETGLEFVDGKPLVMSQETWDQYKKILEDYSVFYRKSIGS